MGVVKECRQNYKCMKTASLQAKGNHWYMKYSSPKCNMLTVQKNDTRKLSQLDYKGIKFLRFMQPIHTQAPQSGLIIVDCFLLYHTIPSQKYPMKI